MNKQEEIKKISDEIILLQESSLYDYRIENNYKPVVGSGSLDTHIVFVGEAPGKNEAETGKPFCGRSGKLLDELLLSIGLSRNDIYITNLVKDRPPDNRDPSQKEIDLYSKFLDRQLEVIKPKVIVMLGRLSMKYIFEKAGIKEELTTIGEMHGKEYEGNFSYGKVILLPLYHPAFGIYNSKKKPELFKDFELLKMLI